MINAEQARYDADWYLIESDLGKETVKIADAAIKEAVQHGCHSVTIKINHIFNTDEDRFTAADFEMGVCGYFESKGYRVDFNPVYKEGSESRITLYWSGGRY